MELAKQFIDVGLFTNQIDEMRAFYGERIRLPYEELLPVGRRRPAVSLRLARLGAEDKSLARSAGATNRGRLPDAFDFRSAHPNAAADAGSRRQRHRAGAERASAASIRSKSISASPTRPPSRHFYGDAMQADRVGAGRFKLGETIISFRHDPAAVRAPKTASASAGTSLRRCARSGCVTSRCRCATATASIAASCRWACGKARRR